MKDDAILLVKRSKDPAAGLWTLPGGSLEVGERLTDAVRREVKEETGLDVVVHDLLGIFEVVGDPHYVILDYSATPTDSAEAVAADDAEEARWIPLTEVQHLQCTPRFVETLTAWGILPEPAGD